MNDKRELQKLSRSQAGRIGSLDFVFDGSRHAPGFKMVLSDATIGVSQDRLGDWTIAVGLSQRSERYRRIVASLESFGFFQATENEGTAFLLWTSLFSEVGNTQVVVEQTLSEALRVLKPPVVPHYIG